jgi:hypothetical protein
MSAAVVVAAAVVAESVVAASTQLGSFNESGTITNFERKGFTPEKCIGEIAANSMDAMFYAVHRDNRPLPRVHNPKIEFRVTAKYIDIVDNGYGMTLERVRNMLDLNRENHGNHKALGVSGFGFKPATYILSGKQEIHVYTKVLGGESLRVTIPWDQITTTGKYTNMSSCQPAPFPEEYLAMEMGTVLRFPYSPFLETKIHANFMDKSVPNLDRMSVIFGKFHVEISYKNAIKNPHKNHILNMYDYFGGKPLDYYTGKIYEDIIHQYKNNNGEYLFLWENVLDGKKYHIPKSGKGYSKGAKPYTSNMIGWDHYIGEYLVRTGMRIKPEYFDIQNPRIPTSHERWFSDYDTEHIGDDFDIMAKLKVSRNEQMIGCTEWANAKTTSARGSVKGMHTTFHTNCHLSYNPISSANNIQDITMGIQENKNQYTGEAIPVNMRRLVEEIRNKTATIIWSYFEELVGDNEHDDDSCDGNDSSSASDDGNDTAFSDDTGGALSSPDDNRHGRVDDTPSSVVPSSSDNGQSDIVGDHTSSSVYVVASTTASESAAPSSLVHSSITDDDIDESMFTNVPVIDHTRILIPREIGVKMLHKLMPYAEVVSETIVEILCKINGKEGDKIMKETFEIMRNIAPQMLIVSLQHLYENIYSSNENVKCGTTLYVLYTRYIMKK